jgi:hypothetical protein
MKGIFGLPQYNDLGGTWPIFMVYIIHPKPSYFNIFWTFQIAHAIFVHYADNNFDEFLFPQENKVLARLEDFSLIEFAHPLL